MDKQTLKESYLRVVNRINELSGFRKVTLLLATKTQCAEDINYLINEGCSYIGENRVNELLEKYESYDKRAELHFIGTLQSNKVKYIIDKVDLIHSVDTVTLLEEINKRAAKINKIQNILIEINSGKEENKGGVMPEDAVAFYKKAMEYANIKVCGLMTMAPRCETREEYLHYFGITKKLFDELFENDENAILSMGMSESYEYAIEAGANLVRVGSLVFGKRNYDERK